MSTWGTGGGADCSQVHAQLRDVRRTGLGVPFKKRSLQEAIQMCVCIYVGIHIYTYKCTNMFGGGGREFAASHDATAIHKQADVSYNRGALNQTAVL